MNPLLWRPLAGMRSFEIPPYRFDLTPLLPRLNDGEEHNFTLAVWNASSSGVWYLDPVLLLRRRRGWGRLLGPVKVLSSTPGRAPEVKLKFRNRNLTGVATTATTTATTSQQNEI